MKSTIVGLKELRGNMDAYISKVKNGKSFIVVRKSKPLFKIIPLEFENQWETVIDFTEISKNGIAAKEILKELRQLNVQS